MIVRVNLIMTYGMTLKSVHLNQLKQLNRHHHHRINKLLLKQTIMTNHQFQIMKLKQLKFQLLSCNYQRRFEISKDNAQDSTYANLFEKDVKVEKVGDKYQYTFKVKEANGNSLITKRTKYQFSKITHNGENIILTDQGNKVKEAVLTTDKLLDKINLKQLSFLNKIKLVMK